MTTDPPQPIAAQKTQIYFQLSPADGIEKYIGAWAHMLAASDDLIDLIHTHPFIADGGPQIQFNLEFPRARTYRVWVQFQRKGVVNTAHFDVPGQGVGVAEAREQLNRAAGGASGVIDRLIQHRAFVRPSGTSDH